MGIKISLDTNAVNTLFPEGTEARVKLQASVMSNIVKTMALKMSSDEQSRVVSLVQNELRALNKGCLLSKSLGSPELSDYAKKAVQAEYLKMIRDESNKIGIEEVEAARLESLDLIKRYTSSVEAKSVAANTTIGQTVDLLVARAGDKMAAMKSLFSS